MALSNIKSSSGVSVVVAAADSHHPERADYVGDGSGEQDVIQAAIDELPGRGGKIELQGHFYTSDTIHLYRDVDPWFNLFLQGEGLSATRIELVAGSNCDVIDNVVLDYDSGWKGVADMTLAGNEVGQTSGHGISCSRSGTGAQFDMRFRNVFAYDMKECGFKISDGWGVYLDNCLGEFCGSHGIDFVGNECYIYGFHSSANAGDGMRIRGSELHVSECRISAVDIGMRIQNLSRSIISNNTIADFGQAGGSRVGMYILGDSYQDNIHGNTITGNGANSVYGIFHSGTGTTPINVYGNTIDGCTSNSLYVDGTYLNFHNNVITTPTNAIDFAAATTAGNIIRDNIGLNPHGVKGSSFDNTNYNITSFKWGQAAGPTVANQDYTCQTTPVRIISSGGTAVAIVIKDAAGTTICSPGATCDEYLEIGEKINFGNFSAAPTTTEIFK